MIEKDEGNTNKISGPRVYENWILANKGEPSLETNEYPLFTDARMTGEETEGYGPYQFLNPVPLLDRPGLIQTAILLRMKIHFKIETSIPDTIRTNTDFFHGGGLTDEIAALSSLALGARLKAGGLSRCFEPSGDPLGRPVAYDYKSVPVVITGIRGLVLPQVVGEHSLTDLLPLTLLPNLSPSDAIALIRAARLYQDALWIAESEPSLSWVMLVSAIETAAGHWKISESSPIERLRSSIPDLYSLLDSVDRPGFIEEVADLIADRIGATKKFIDFILTFLPVPPPNRPAEWGRHSWEYNNMKKSLKLIYDYRSKALHSGYPFPVPMCEVPFRHESWGALAERPIGIATSAKGGTWLAEDTPMLLHTFEYIVRHTLIKWWKSMGNAT